MRLTSREYKVIADSSYFADPEAAVAAVHDDLHDLGQVLDVRLKGVFDSSNPKERTIRFLDTPDFTLRRNDVLLRQRVRLGNGKIEYTLKCRSEDRYIVAGKDLSQVRGFKGESKFEEDIGVPFVSRFSQSNTIRLDGDHTDAADFPETLAQAGKLFPALLDLRHDGLPCAGKTALAPVNGLQVFEQVFAGPVLHFHRAPATVALILWRKGKKGRLLTAEFSFRYADDQENYPLKVAVAARRYFEGLQRLDWTKPEALTKTQFMYANG